MTSTGFPGLWPTSRQRRRRIAALTLSTVRSSATIPRPTTMSALVSQAAGRRRGAPLQSGTPLGISEVVAASWATVSRLGKRLTLRQPL